MSKLSETTPPKGFRVRRLSAGRLLGSLVLLILISPFLEGFEAGDLVYSVLLSLVLMSASLMVGGHRRLLVLNLCLAIPAVLGSWAHALWPSIFSGEAALVAALLFTLFAVINILRYILRAPKVDTEVLCAGLASYLLLGLLWAFAYLLADAAFPHSFAHSLQPGLWRMDNFSSFYFSFCTLSTVGYGDITPISRLARMLAMMQAVTGMLYVAVLISRLVGLYAKDSAESRSGGSNDL